MVGDALGQGQIVVVEIAERGGAAQDGDLGQRLELGHDSLQPVVAGAAVEVRERAALGQQRAAELGVALGQDHPRAAAAGGQRRHQPGRPAADHQHVAMRVPVQVAVGVGPASARGPARRRGG